MPGMLVLIKEDNTIPLHWPMGRIQEVIIGKDGLVRVATIKTNKGIFKRAIHNLAPLPVENNGSQENATKEELAETASDDKIQNKRKTESSNTFKKRKKYSFNATIFIVTLLLLPLIVLGYPTSSAPFKITHFNENKGVYIDNIGSSKLIKGEWQIIAFYNLTKYWRTYSSLKVDVQKLNKLTKNTTDHHYASTLVEQFNYRLQEINEGNQLLFSSSSFINRKQRGLINGVGNLANFLFGVLDDNYAKHAEKEILNVKANEKYLLNLMKNQTSVIEATEHLIYQIVSLFAQYISLTIDEFKKMQEKLLDILVDLHHEKVSPTILSPNQLQMHLEQIKQHLSEDLVLPPVSDLYGLMTIKCKMGIKNAIFIFTIPLLSKENFDLFQLIPFPANLNNSYMSVQPFTEFIMIDKFVDSAYKLSENDFEKCIKLNDDKYLCLQVRPYYTKMANSLQCEFQLFKQQSLSNSCRLNIKRPKRTWKQLRKSNNWLYAIPQEYMRNIICSNERYQVKLSGNDIGEISQPFIYMPDEMNVTIATIDSHQFAVSYLALILAAALVIMYIRKVITHQKFNITNAEPSVRFKAEDFEVDVRDINEGEKC
ncbi:uncharacterized protein LOC129607724 [Condylostylus longicornis]|uniref:uncharacterized protein LOC129607724 n=1 Tax=Condylostylus longicornis TaxID=2530218 RepID=UPI00244E027B|nr:uncharacterized protein LOC129607724 [Condylostylus longicornis]